MGKDETEDNDTDTNNASDNQSTENGDSEEVFRYSLNDDDFTELADEVEDILEVEDKSDKIAEIREDVENLRNSESNIKRRLNSVENTATENKNLIQDRIEDVREKIITLARRQEEKSEKDHNHPELLDDLSEVEERIEEIESDFQDQSQEIQSLKDDIKTVSDRESDLREKATDLAHSHLELKEAFEDLRDYLEEENDDRLSRILTEAQKNQVSVADCQNCGSKIDISILRESECPFCESQLSGLETRLIRSNYLVVEESNNGNHSSD